MDPLTDALIDTVALVRHLADSLPPAAEAIFKEAENRQSQLYVPEIALGEFVYLGLRGKLGVPRPRALVEEVLSEIRGAGYIQTCSLGAYGWEVLLNLEIPELHDRMIAASAIERELPLVSNDPAFRRIEELQVLWS